MPFGAKRIFFFGALALFLWGTWEFCASFASLGDIVGVTQPATERRSLRPLRVDGAVGSLPRFSRSALPKPRTSHPAAAESDAPFHGEAAVELPVIDEPPPFENVIRQTADAYVAANRASWNIRDYHELRPEVIQTPRGSEVKYTAYQNGVPIVGMDIHVEVGADQQVSGVRNGYSAVRPADLEQPVLDYPTILKSHQGRFGADQGSTAGVSKVLYLSDGGDTPELAYVIPVRDNGEGQQSEVVFRASDGRVLGRRPPSGAL